MKDRYLADNRSSGVSGSSAPNERDLVKAITRCRKYSRVNRGLVQQSSKSIFQTPLSRSYISSPKPTGGRWSHLVKEIQLNLVGGRKPSFRAHLTVKMLNNTNGHQAVSSATGLVPSWSARKKYINISMMVHMGKRGWTRVLSGRAHDVPELVPLGRNFRLVSQKPMLLSLYQKCSLPKPSKTGPRRCDSQRVIKGRYFRTRTILDRENASVPTN